ncbi:hypothetical protein C5Y96_01245 [Blastopirellula marina]|uniref:MobA/VirD2-like nuclease domain-containing protein n=1 Tax=Blastopirellula marina TaxID=124 RepID=A0A2S8G8G6_9BACT|nr:MULTISPECIES: relaxase/mobilization nuclease domain-containing protein [Pirellulaceae]PQO40752.1 hypothetical protein C5Y96_01245 [Blastopirellula marina]RCS56062.1 hypothetical protein DTL36_01245 [Bremerella cremea]
MIDRVHTKYGQSFKGCATYLLHDKNATTRQRVAWTSTRNLATKNPDAAWRVMAVTAKDQDRLKREAGIRPGGKPGKGPVLHLTLSWHAEEAKDLSKEEMLRAAYGAIRAVRLDDRQTLIVCHDDEPQPHVHILVNRVSPEDGRLPKDFNDYRKLSRWAKKYEKERGKIYCDQRVINEKARERGEYVKAEGNKTRHLVEMQQAVNDNDAKKQLEEQHRQMAHAIKERERQQQQRHTKQWAELEVGHRQRVAEIRERAKHAIGQELMQIRNRYRPRWGELYYQQQAEIRHFELEEERAIGWMRNVIRSIDFRSFIGLASRDDGRVKTISQAFELIVSTGARRKALERQHALQDKELEKQQKAEERSIVERMRAFQNRQLLVNRQRFQRDRNDLLLIRDLEKARIRADWLEKGRQMRRELYRLKQLECERNGPENDRNVRHMEQPRTNPSDLLPKEGADQAAKQIDEYRDRFQDRRERGRFHERDDDRDR